MNFFFFNDTATTEIYTLSLHDALPIYDDRADHLRVHDADVGILARLGERQRVRNWGRGPRLLGDRGLLTFGRDRKSTRLNSSHANISYAVFCFKKKKIYNNCH